MFEPVMFEPVLRINLKAHSYKTYTPQPQPPPLKKTPKTNHTQKTLTKELFECAIVEHN